MHGFVYETEFLYDISGVLTAYYVALALINLVAAGWCWRGRGAQLVSRRGRWSLAQALLWAVVAGVYLVLAWVAHHRDPAWLRWIGLPDVIRGLMDRLLGPVVFSVGLVVAFVVFYTGRRFWVRPTVAWAGLNLFFLWMGLSLVDPDFAAIVGKPDNIPIVGMIVLTGYFTWLGTRRAVRNDDRLRAGQPPEEAEAAEHILVWPDLVYIELICMVLLTAGLIIWSISVRAPLEGPANVMQTPNPSKAPWYFVGLQELLVYFDPWMAGVAIPGLIIFGLLAIPYLDTNERGNGYYTIAQRPFAYVTFQVGFLLLWIALILIGTFMRGPNWGFYGLYQSWDPHNAQLLHNVSLSDYFWTEYRGVRLPRAPTGSSIVTRAGYIMLREAPGLILLAVYSLGLPSLLLVLSRRVRRARQRLGTMRFIVLVVLLLLMALVPIKMICRWTFNLKYIVAIPELLLSV